MENFLTGNKKICVVGLGYIGLPTSALLAASGQKVIGIDIDQSVVASINRGEVHIVEPGLESLRLPRGAIMRINICTLQQHDKGQRDVCDSQAT